jgi:hypothetical protein
VFFWVLTQDVVAYHTMPLPGYQVTPLNNVVTETGNREFVIEVSHLKQTGTLPAQKNMLANQKTTFYLQAESADQMNR